MDSLFLLQFACFIFMLINAFIVALSHLHVRWENKRYERSRWMIVIALIGFAIQYVIQMGFGFRAADDSIGAVVNILIYMPCFSLISMGIYNIVATHSNLRKMILMCSGIYAAIIVVFCVGISLHHSLYIREGLYLMLTLFCVSVFYCIYMVNNMERKEQTGHICRWMALGIMTAIVIVGCTIVIGLFEWRDRKEIECKNAELHQWRKNVHDLNLHITELSLLGEKEKVKNCHIKS